MAVEDVILIETINSGSLVADAKSPTGRLEYFAYGSDDANDVIGAVELTVPATYGLLAVQRIDPQPRGAGNWIVTVDYAVPDINTTTVDTDTDPSDDPPDDEALGPEFSAEISAGTQHISQSLTTVARYKRTGSSDNFDDYNYGGLIGVTKDNRVEGMDRLVPQGELNFTRYIKVLTFNYIGRLMDTVATVNSVKYKGRPAGSLLFLGASISKWVPKKGWPINYKFAAGKNRTDISVSPDIQAITKDAWDYLWCYYDEFPRGPGGRLQLRPRFVFIERIYERTNFKTALGV